MREARKRPLRPRDVLAIVGAVTAPCFVGCVLVPAAWMKDTRRIPLSHHVAAVPGSTSLRFAMLHDILTDRYDRPSRAWHEARVAKRLATIREAEAASRLADAAISGRCRPARCSPSRASRRVASVAIFRGAGSRFRRASSETIVFGWRSGPPTRPTPRRRTGAQPFPRLTRGPRDRPASGATRAEVVLPDVHGMHRIRRLPAPAEVQVRETGTRRDLRSPPSRHPERGGSENSGVVSSAARIRSS